MSIAKIRSALVQAVQAGSFGLSVVYENTNSFTPQADTPWAAFSLSMTPPNVASLGDSGQNEYTGFAQLLLSHPLNSGAGASLEKADEIAAAFKPGSLLTYQGQAVRITRSGADSPFIDQGYYKTPVTIYWRAFAER